MDAIVYRPLQTSDADAVFAVAREAWQFTYATIFDPAFIDQFVSTNYAPARLRELIPLLEANQLFFDVALDADQPIGFCNIGMSARGAQLFRIYVRPAYIGDGVGSTLLERGEQFVQTRGLSSYYCFVHKDNELGKRFYLRRGFRHRPESDRNDEWCMEKQVAEGNEQEALALLIALGDTPGEYAILQLTTDLRARLERTLAPAQRAAAGSLAQQRPLLVWLAEIAARSTAAQPVSPPRAQPIVPEGGLHVPETGQILSSREVEVLRLLIAGASNPGIAEALIISRFTVKNHVARILEKLGVTTRTQAALRGRELGLVPFTPH